MPVAIPPIRRGEIKNVKSYRAALRQLALRPDVPGNTALALYDDTGNVHLQVFARAADGVRRLVFDRPVGRVAAPGGAAGTARFGNAIEPRVLGLLARLTGQRFRAKRANAGGADIEPGELERAGVSPAVHRWLREVLSTARTWRAAPAADDGTRMHRRVWADSRARKLLAMLATLSVRELDFAMGALAALERSVGETPWIARCRQAARARLGLAGA